MYGLKILQNLITPLAERCMPSPLSYAGFSPLFFSKVPNMFINGIPDVIASCFNCLFTIGMLCVIGTSLKKLFHLVGSKLMINICVLGELVLIALMILEKLYKIVSVGISRNRSLTPISIKILAGFRFVISPIRSISICVVLPLIPRFLTKQLRNISCNSRCSIWLSPMNKTSLGSIGNNLNNSVLNDGGMWGGVFCTGGL